MLRRFLITAVLLSQITVSAKDAATMFKSKCAGCHGPNGQGKTGPNIAGASEDQVVDVLTKGGKTKAPHKKAMHGVTTSSAKTIATYVHSLTP